MNRTVLRKRLLLAGVVPAVLVLAFALKVVLMLSNNGDGRDAFARGTYAAAADAFAANRTLDLLEPWVTAFDEGTAEHADGELASAIALYTDALADVPAEEECTVRINLALAHEAVGGALMTQQSPDRKAAEEAWQAGVDVLAEGGCPERSGRGAEQTADAKAVDERLRKLLEKDPPEKKKDKKRPQDPDEPEPPTPEEKELQRRNQAGQTERNNQRQKEGDANLRGPTW